MVSKKSEDKERILNYLIRKGSLCNTYKVARELEMEREEILEILNELAKENKVLLMHGSVKAITKELSEEEKVKTKSEVEYLKERVERLEKILDFTFSQLIEAVYLSHQKLSKRKKIEQKSEEDLDEKEG
ncbi:MAG: hypothetical protein AB1668_02250 [Nanoarchaeota archaeon]